MYVDHSQTMDQVTTRVLFIEFPELYFHIDLYLDSIYISGICRFRFYFFFYRDFVVPLTHPQFDLSTPYIAIPLYMAHLFPPPTAVAAPAIPPAAPSIPTSPPQVVPSLSHDDEENPSEASASPHDSSLGPSDSYTPAEPGMVNRFLLSASD